jgi:hypothetical protein
MRVPAVEDRKRELWVEPRARVIWRGGSHRTGAGAGHRPHEARATPDPAVWHKAIPERGERGYPQRVHVPSRRFMSAASSLPFGEGGLQPAPPAAAEPITQGPNNRAAACVPAAPA